MDPKMNRCNIPELIQARISHQDSGTWVKLAKQGEWRDGSHERPYIAKRSWKGGGLRWEARLGQNPNRTGCQSLDELESDVIF